MANGKVGSRWAWTISAVYYDLQRESGTSLTIGAGPGTGRNQQVNINGTQFSVWIFRLGILDKMFRSFWKFSGQANSNAASQITDLSGCSCL